MISCGTPFLRIIRKRSGRRSGYHLHFRRRKSDTGNITDLFGKDNVVLVPDPVYPVYVDTNLMDGRKIVYMNGTAENDFLPMPDPSVKADLIYLCSPNNPTGACYSKEQLEKWVAYAKEMQAVILFDAAYEAFVSDPALPRSIFEIEGAKECAIEFCSLSKTAGFTGTRCLTPSFPKNWYSRHLTEQNSPYMPCGTGDIPPNLTGRRISCSVRRRQSSQKKEWRSAWKTSNTTGRMQRSLPMC